MKPSGSSGRSLSVLVVDDSAVMREAMKSLLSQEPGFEVTVAADPIIAMEKMKKARPDVILLDLEMPRMDGMSFLRMIMKENPIPVVVCSARSGSAQAYRALDEGAVEFVAKPQVGIREFLHESAVLIFDALRAAAQAKLSKRPAPPPRPPPAQPKSVPIGTSVAPAGDGDRIVALGASTGGTEAIAQILAELSPDSPGMVIVQHMPEGFTAAFAKRLNDLSPMEVKEAAGGDEVRPGRALIAPGNRHMVMRRTGQYPRVEVVGGPLVTRHRPSVDMLFRSVAVTAGGRALGILLTGMGSDGADGLLEMRKEGALTIAQDEASSVVFGMPREAIARGAAAEVLPLDRMASAISRFATSSIPRGRA